MLRVRSLCVAATLLALVACARNEAPEFRKPRNLLIVTFDTVRRDHLGVYGYERPTSPTLDALAGRGIVFDRAFTADVNTSPSHAAMFTGLYPHQNGDEANGMWLDRKHDTLSELLRSRGLHTGAFLSGVTLKRNTGLDQGFDEYQDAFDAERRDGATTTTLAIEWLRALPKNEPFFLFLHLFDAHGPYEPKPGYTGRFVSSGPGQTVTPPDYQRRFDDDGTVVTDLNFYVDRYDDQIAYVDEQLQRILAAIDRGTTMVIVLADHGETLGERPHALDHGCQPHDEQSRIPLVIAYPGFHPRRFESLVETVDLLPTILDAFGIPRPSDTTLAGVSLFPLLRGRTVREHEYAYTSARADAARYPRFEKLDEDRRILSIRSKRWRLIDYPTLPGDTLELYDLEADPGETSDVASSHEDVVRTLRAEIARWYPDYRKPMKRPEIPEGAAEQFRSLGYLGGH